MSMIPSYPASYSGGPGHLRLDDDSPPSFIPPYQSGTPEEEEELALLQQLERGGEAFHGGPPVQMGRHAIDDLGELPGQDELPRSELPQIEEQDEWAGLLEPATKPPRSARAAWFRDQFQDAETVGPGDDELRPGLEQGQEQNQIPRRPHPTLEDFEAMPKSQLLKEAAPGESPAPRPKPESGPQMEKDGAADAPSRHSLPLRPRLDYTPAEPKPQDDKPSPAVPPDLDWTKASPNPLYGYKPDDSPKAGPRRIGRDMMKDPRTPPGAISHSVTLDSGEGASLLVPPGYDPQAVYDSGNEHARGDSPLSLWEIRKAVGHFGTFDLQRNAGQGDLVSNSYMFTDKLVPPTKSRDNTFYSAYTAASNYNVGLYLGGSGRSWEEAKAIAEKFAHMFSSNAGDPEQVEMWKAGWEASRQMTPTHPQPAVPPAPSPRLPDIQPDGRVRVETPPVNSDDWTEEPRYEHREPTQMERLQRMFPNIKVMDHLSGD